MTLCHTFLSNNEMSLPTHYLFRLLAGLAVASLFTGCGHEQHHEEHVRFLVSTPYVTDTALVREFVGQIRSVNHIELRALERGYLEQIFVDEGQFVRKGQLMFKIKPSIYQAEYQRAVAEAEFAEIEYRNTRALADSNIVSRNELALAKAKLDKARAEMELMRAHLDFTEIRAPFDGIMGKFMARLGSLLEEGELLSTLSDNSRMWVYFNVPEADYLNYMNRRHDTTMVVKLRLANHELFDQLGRVETIEADFNNETGNIAFRATFPNPRMLLRHGETGNILVQTNVQDALIIPQKATFEILEKKYVFVVDSTNHVHSREVGIAAELPDLYVIGRGLAPTDRILVEGIRKVREGDSIAFELRTPLQVVSTLRVAAE
jgi:membrane fusion protein (multidrug efflux system)